MESHFHTSERPLQIQIEVFNIFRGRNLLTRREVSEILRRASPSGSHQYQYQSPEALALLAVVDVCALVVVLSVLCIEFYYLSDI